MKPGGKPFAGIDLEQEIAQRAGRFGIELDGAARTTLATHARAVLRENAHLHLTTLTEPAEFLDRHVAESFAGASLLEPDIRGSLLDLGSGNGYPGLPLAVARPGLRAFLAEAASRKSAFLQSVIDETGFAASVLARQVQRPEDLPDASPLRVLALRAVGNWERLVPRLAPALSNDGRVLLWAGESVESVRTRSAWRRLELIDRQSLAGRDRSWVWSFRSTRTL